MFNPRSHLLFLGYLQGVPFWWVMKNCWPMWAIGVGILLAIFPPRSLRENETASETWKFDGLPNLFFLAVILGAVFANKPIFLREAIMLDAALGSYFTNQKSRA